MNRRHSWVVHRAALKQRQESRHRHLTFVSRRKVEMPPRQPGQLFPRLPERCKHHGAPPIGEARDVMIGGERLLRLEFSCGCEFYQGSWEGYHEN